MACKNKNKRVNVLHEYEHEAKFLHVCSIAKEYIMKNNIATTSNDYYCDMPYARLPVLVVTVNCV